MMPSSSGSSRLREKKLALLDVEDSFNPLAPELFFLIFAHPVFKM
jgi:hypothetical protein